MKPQAVGKLLCRLETTGTYGGFVQVEVAKMNGNEPAIFAIHEVKGVGFSSQLQGKSVLKDGL